MLKKKTSRRKRANAKKTLRQRKLRLRRQKGGFAWDEYVQFLRQYYSIIYLKSLPKGPTPAEIKSGKSHYLIKLPISSLDDKYESDIEKHNKPFYNLFGRKMQNHPETHPKHVYESTKVKIKLYLSLQIENLFLNLMWSYLNEIKPSYISIEDDKRILLFSNQIDEAKFMNFLQNFEHGNVDSDYVEIKKTMIIDILQQIFHIPEKDANEFFNKFDNLFSILADKVIEYLYKLDYFNKQQLHELGLDVQFKSPKPNKFFSPGIKYIKFTLTPFHREQLENLVQNFIIDKEGKKTDEEGKKTDEETYGFDVEDA